MYQKNVGKPTKYFTEFLHFILPTVNGKYTLPSSFSYAGYSARFLTYQEVFNGCYYDIRPSFVDGLVGRCQFLMQGSRWGLETPSSRDEMGVYEVSDWNLYEGGYDVFRVRPAIEVLKSEMSY